MPQIVMPRLVEHMEEAMVARWLFADGDEVRAGDEIVEIETDKATTAVESEFDGSLRILAEEGAMVAVDAPLAEVGAPPPAAEDGAAAESDLAPEPDLSPAPAAAVVSSAAPAPAPSNGSGRLLASPVARRIADEHGFDLRGLQASRSSGRILKRDVLRALEAPPRAVSEPAVGSQVAVGSEVGSATLQEMTRTQQLIARRMTESTSTIPDFAVATDVDMSACVELRAELKLAAEEPDAAPSYNDLVVKAVALALRAFPRANGSYRDGKFELHSRVNVGVAVAGEGSLVVPTVFDADGASLGSIATTTRELARKVREGTVGAPELAGGTFTVSNLGMYGVTHFTAVVNPPQAAILAVGAIEDQAVVRDGEVCVRPMMTVNLTSDHRILYGADAAQFVARVRALLEKPLAMIL